MTSSSSQHQLDLAESHSDLRDFIENIAVPLHWVGPDGTILWANKAELDFLGYAPEEYIGRKITEFHADSRAIRDILDRLTRNEELHGYEARLRRKDGSVCDVAITSNVYWRNGEFIHTRCVTREIKLSRRALEVQSRLAAIVESSDDAIISKDLNGIIQSWNRGAERLFGYTEQETVGNHISMLAPPERVHEIPHILERIARGERIDHHETQRRTKDGRILTVSLTVSPIRDASGTVIAASKIARDITEQKRANELQARMAAIVESSDDAILSKDLDGYIQSWNRGAQRIFGYTADEVIGKHISMLAAPESIDEIPEILARLRRGERVDHYQTKRKTKDGRTLTVSLTISPVQDASGKIVGISKVARDVTDLVRSAEELRAANEALKLANADLEQFAYSASHDLQEPLRTISAYTSLLRRKFEGQLGPEGDEYIQYTLDGTKRMHQLLNDILAFTRASNVAEGESQDSDASVVLAEVLEDLNKLVAETNAAVTCGDLPCVRIPHVHLQQIFQNLITNAIRYRADAPPQIHIAAERHGPDWLFSVRDNGIGIDPQYQDQIFGIFKRLHTSAEYPGTGMGLAICQRLVQRARGRIWVESELGKGAAFFFTLPPCP